MTEQITLSTGVVEGELFPRTPREIAEHFLEHFQADVERAEKSLAKAHENLREAIALRDEAELNLGRAIADERASVTVTSTTVAAAAEYIEDAEVIEDDPEPEVEDEGSGEPAPAAMVWVVWPDAEESFSLVIGERTRFGEIVANYLNANPDVDFLAKYVISDAEGMTWDAKAIIGSENYGREFFIEREVALKKEEA